MATLGGKRIAGIITKLKTIHIYAVAFVIGVAVVAGYLYTDHKKLQNALNKVDYSQRITREEKSIKAFESDLKAGIHKTTYTCEHFLAIGDYNEMYRLAVQTNNKKYIGIYYVIINIPSQAVPLLSQYGSLHPFDEEALAYLGYAYFKQKNYPQAIAVLSKIKHKSYKVHYDMAVAYEKMGDFTDAEIHYTQALTSTDDPVYRNLIKEKLAVLRVSGGKRWTFPQGSQ